MKVWPFLVSRNFEFDYRTVVSPDILVDCGESILLAKAAGGKVTDDGICVRRQVNGSALGLLTLIYRVILIKKHEIGLQGDDYVRDEHGRAISLIEGLVLKGTWESKVVSSKVFDSIHSLTLEKYKEFWQWDDFQLEFEVYASDQSLNLDDPFEGEISLEIKETPPFTVQRVSCSSIGRLKVRSIGKIPLAEGSSYIKFSSSNPEILGITAARLNQVWSLNRESIEEIRKGQIREYINRNDQKFIIFENKEAFESRSKRLITLQETNNHTETLFLKASSKTEIKSYDLSDKDVGNSQRQYKINDGQVLKFICDSNYITGITTKGLLFQIDLDSGSTLEGSRQVSTGETGKNKSILSSSNELKFEKVAFNQRFAAVVENKQIIIYELSSLKEFKCFDRKESKRELTTICLSSTNNQMALGYDKGYVIVRSILDDQTRREIDDFHSPVTALTFSRDGKLLAIGTENGCLTVFNLSKSGQEDELFQTQVEGRIDSLAFNCNTSILVSSGYGPESYAHVFEII